MPDTMKEIAGNLLTHLKMKMKSIRSEKKIATLSIVRSITNSCLLRFGINRTNFKILSRRKVRSTDNPELPLVPSPSIHAWQSSTALMGGSNNKI